MIVTTVMVQVKEEHIEDFIEAMRDNHENSILEEGNVRFDINQNDKDSTKFMLYEAYENEEAALAHKKTEHYLKWKEKVDSWMAVPREGIRYKILFPEKIRE